MQKKIHTNCNRFSLIQWALLYTFHDDLYLKPIARIILFLFIQYNICWEINLKTFRNLIKMFEIQFVCLTLNDSFML